MKPLPPTYLVVIVSRGKDAKLAKQRNKPDAPAMVRLRGGGERVNAEEGGEGKRRGIRGMTSLLPTTTR